MKTIIIFFAIFFVAVLGENTEYRITLDTKYDKECADQSKAAADRIASIKKNTLEQDEMNSKDKCYITCMLEKNNILRASQYLRVDRFTNGMSEVKAKKVKEHLKRCDSRTPTYNKRCLDVINVLNCFIRTMETVENVKLITVYRAVKSFK